jgi:hypothetical protein
MAKLRIRQVGYRGIETIPGAAREGGWQAGDTILAALRERN